MLNARTKAVAHFGKFVPCCEGRVISCSDNRAKLIRVDSKEDAERIANLVSSDLSNAKVLQGPYRLGDNYMLSQHPVTAP